MRWKGFITFFTALFLFIGGLYLFAPRIIKSSVEGLGTALWGARVELEEVQLSYFPLSLRLKGLAVASRREEYRNMMEADNLTFSLLIPPLLERKINIEEISGTGLAFGTERETSGFLPRDTKEREEAEEGRWRRQLSKWLSDVKERSEERIELPRLEAGELQSYSKAEEIRTDLEELKQESEHLKEKDGSELVLKLENSIENIKNIRIRREEDIRRAREEIKEVQDTIKEAEGFIEEIDRAAGRFNSEISRIRDAAGLIEEARSRDYRNIMEKLRLPSIEIEDIAQTVFGPLVTERFKTFSGYLEKVRRYVPPRDQKKRVSRPPRFKGEDIIFYREKMAPPFMVKKALVSGREGEYLKAEDFSTAPWVLGRPAAVSGAAEYFVFNASFDRSREEPQDLIKINYRNFMIGRSTGDLSLEAKLEGDGIEADITWRGRGLLPSDWLEYIRLDDPEIDIVVKVRGKRRAPSFNISSNIDRILSQRLKAELDRQISSARTQVQEFIDREIEPLKRRVLQEADQLRKETEASLERGRKMVKEKQREAEEEIDKKRKEIEELLRERGKETEERLRNFLGR